MSNTYKIIGIVLGIILIGALGFFGYQALSDDEDSTTSSAQQSVENTQESNEQTEEIEEAPEVKGAVIKTGDSQFGTILFDDAGQAIYIWEVEESDAAECYGDCAEAWPPVLTDGEPQATGDVNGDLLGTTVRTDGTTQVTYNGHPLYYYAHEAPGEVKCHNVSTHGGLWWVIQPDGNRAD